jgi:hypothetical protein
MVYVFNVIIIQTYTNEKQIFFITTMFKFFKLFNWKF